MEVFLTSNYEIFLQLLTAVVLGMLLGAERSLAGKTAGMRTYGLVSMGACLFILTSTLVLAPLSRLAAVDPLRVFEGVVTGVGFIGAGIIFLRGATLNGLTTAAGLWIAAGIGIAVGYKLYALAVFAAVLTIFVFTAMWFLERKIRTLSQAHNRPEAQDDEL